MLLVVSEGELVLTWLQKGFGHSQEEIKGVANIKLLPKLGIVLVSCRPGVWTLWGAEQDQARLSPMGSQQCREIVDIYCGWEKIPVWADKFGKLILDIFRSKDRECLRVEIEKGVFECYDQSTSKTFCIWTRGWDEWHNGAVAALPACAPVPGAGSQPQSPLTQNQISPFYSKGTFTSPFLTPCSEGSMLDRVLFTLALWTLGKICICTLGYLGAKSIQALLWPCWLAWKCLAKMTTEEHAGDLQKIKWKRKKQVYGV